MGVPTEEEETGASTEAEPEVATGAAGSEVAAPEVATGAAGPEVVETEGVVVEEEATEAVAVAEVVSDQDQVES